MQRFPCGQTTRQGGPCESAVWTCKYCNETWVRRAWGWAYARSCGWACDACANNWGPHFAKERCITPMQRQKLRDYVCVDCLPPWMKAPPPPPGPPPPLDHACDQSIRSQRAALATNDLIQRIPSIQTPPPLQTPPDAAASQNLTRVQSDGCSQTHAARVDRGTSVQSLDFGKPVAASGNATPRDSLGRSYTE